MVNFTLTDGQSAYDEVGEYIWRYWQHNAAESVVVSLAVSYDGLEYEEINEIADFYEGYLEYQNDWWEGQRWIELRGIKAISEFEIFGGIYEDAERAEEPTMTLDEQLALYKDIRRTIEKAYIKHWPSMMKNYNSPTANKE